MKKILGVLFLVVPIFAHAECKLQFSIPNDAMYQADNIAGFVTEKIRPILQSTSSLVEIDIHQACDEAPGGVLHLKMDEKNYYIMAIQGHDMTQAEYSYQTSSLPLSMAELNRQVSQAMNFETLDLKSKQDAVKEIAFFLAESARFTDIAQIVSRLADGTCKQDWLEYAHLVRRWARLSDFARAMKLDTSTAHGGNQNHLVAPIAPGVITKYNQTIDQGHSGPYAELIDAHDWDNPVKVPPPVCATN